MKLLKIAVLVCGLWAIATASLRAQTVSPRDELLRCVPADFGVSFILNDLRGHSQRWHDLPWITSVIDSQLARDLVGGKEFRDLVKFQGDLQKHLGFDWPTVRDDILGDAVVFAFRPGSVNGDGEQGLMLLHARKADALAKLIKRFNDAQQQSGELTALEERRRQGSVYFQRKTKKGDHYYLVDGSFFAFSASESALHKIIEHRQETAGPCLLVAQVTRAGADKDILTLCLNPRVFDKEIEAKAKGRDAEPVKAFLAYWKALDAVVISVNAGRTLEVRLALQAREKNLPPLARALFREPSRASDLWTRFPGDALITLAGRVDLSAFAERVIEAAPPEIRAMLVDGLKKSVGAALGLDVLKDVLPNLGPDWGVCVLPGREAGHWPQVLAALAVRPGEKGVDQAMLQGMNTLVGWAVIFYNQNHPDEPMQLRTMVQDKVEIKYLANDRFFPPGYSPAYALKDGHFILATAPSAIARFKAGAGLAPSGNDVPLLRISSAEIVKILRQKRHDLVQHIAAKNQISKEAAALGLNRALSVLELMEIVELSERGGSGQVVWTLRIQPAGK